METVHQQRVVAHACEEGRALGVRTGMTLAHARALAIEREVLTHDHDPARDARALKALAIWGDRFSPVVAADAPDGLLMDITGQERLFGSERRLLERMARDLARLGFACRVASASTYGCAWAMARYGEEPISVTPDGAEHDAIAGLPVMSLRASREVALALEELGVERAGQVMDLPRAALPSRFGGELILRLDQALGQAMEAIEPVRAQISVVSERLFTGPTKRLEAVELALEGVLEDLCAQLLSRESGARQIVLELERSDLPRARDEVLLSHPSRDAEHLWSMFRPRLERMNMGFGVEGVRLRAERLGKLRHEQGERWRDDDESGMSPAGRARLSQAQGELIDTLRARLGRERVGAIESRQSHLPRRAFALMATSEPGCPRPGRRAHADVPFAMNDRPSVLFDHPERARVIAVAPEGPPSQVHWRGERRAVVRAIGPERIGGEWWRGGRRHKGTKAQRHKEEDRHEGTEAQRHKGGGRRDKGEGRGDEERLMFCDYFRVELEGGLWVWIGREVVRHEWFVFGVWG